MATVKALHIAIGARVEGFQRGMSKAQRSLRNFEKSTRRARGMVVGATGAMARGFAAVGAAATVAIADSIRVFASFETSMLRIKALTGATGEEFQSLTDTAKELGSRTAFTAREAADAMGFLARAGFDVGEIMRGIPSVLNLAAAGELELATAAEIASNTLRGFGLQASEMDRVANVLAAGAAKSNTSVEALGEAFKMVASDAKGMGLSIEETTAFLGALANVGVKGTMGGTALRVVFAQMGQEILASGGLLPALQALDKDGVAAVVNAMDDLGIRAGSSAIKLANQIPVVEQLTQELGNLDNFAGKMADTMLSGVTGSAVKAGSAFEILRLQLGETFGDFGVGFFEELTLTFQTMNEVIDSMEGEFGDLKELGKDVAQTFLLIAESIGLALTATIDFIESAFQLSKIAGLFSIPGMQGTALQLGGMKMDQGLFSRTEKLQELILKLSAALDPVSRPTAEPTPALVGGSTTQNLNSFEVMSKFLSEGELRQIFPERFPERIAETFTEAIEEFIPVGFATEAPKAAAEEQVSGFTEGIQTALGQVKVDPTAAKKDSDNLQEIAKNTGGMFKEMLTRLESFT